jgi:hypothetical protein
MGLKGLEVTTYASVPLITLSDAKAFLRVDHSDEDDLIELFVDACTRDIENYLKRSLITQTLKLTLDSFESYAEDEIDAYGDGVHDMPYTAVFRNDYINLPRPPALTVTSLTTYDKDNNSAVFASSNYQLDIPNARLYLNEGAVWPTSLRSKNAIEVVYTAGYGGSASDVPSPIRRAAYNHLRKVYNERGECELCESTKHELASYKIEDFLGFS